MGKITKIYKMNYLTICKGSIKNLDTVLTNLELSEVENFLNLTLNSEKVFLVGVGRVMLMLKAFAKRLRHLGINSNVVGETTEPPITNNDLLIVGSGSGESLIPISISKKAKIIGAKIALITTRKKSTISKISDQIIILPCPNKVNQSSVNNNIITNNLDERSQIMTSLFEQALLLFSDIICLMIKDKKGLKEEEIKKHHANLE